MTTRYASTTIDDARARVVDLVADYVKPGVDVEEACRVIWRAQQALQFVRAWEDCERQIMSRRDDAMVRRRLEMQRRELETNITALAHLVTT